MEKGKVHIGTSGWIYRHWTGVFYPQGMPEKEKLKFLAKHFNTVEINYSFYRLPALKTFENWSKETPRGFIFSVKASRYITHIKRLNDVRVPWMAFLRRAKKLGNKLGPILLQFPETFKFNQENAGRLDRFLSLKINSALQLAFEFRDASWQNQEVFKLLKKYDAAFVFADSPRAHFQGAITAYFAYVRMHGGTEMFSSEYSRKELEALAAKIRKWSQAGIDSYIYFNNDIGGYAIKNAKYLLSLFKPQE